MTFLKLLAQIAGVPKSHFTVTCPCFIILAHVNHTDRCLMTVFHYTDTVVTTFLEDLRVNQGHIRNRNHV